MKNKINEKLIELKKAKEEKRIRDIAEDESIRSNIKKSMQDAQANEIQDLQDLINKAVSNGDSETAQALLKILTKWVSILKMHKIVIVKPILNSQKVKIIL